MNNLIIRSEQLDGVFVLQETMNRLVDQLSALSGMQFHALERYIKRNMIDDDQRKALFGSNFNISLTHRAQGYFGPKTVPCAVRLLTPAQRKEAIKYYCNHNNYRIQDWNGNVFDGGSPLMGPCMSFVVKFMEEIIGFKNCPDGLYQFGTNGQRLSKPMRKMAPLVGFNNNFQPEDYMESTNKTEYMRSLTVVQKIQALEWMIRGQYAFRQDLAPLNDKQAKLKKEKKPKKPKKPRKLKKGSTFMMARGPSASAGGVKNAIAQDDFRSQPLFQQVQYLYEMVGGSLSGRSNQKLSPDGRVSRADFMAASLNQQTMWLYRQLQGFDEDGNEDNGLRKHLGKYYRIGAGTTAIKNLKSLSKGRISHQTRYLGKRMMKHEKRMQSSERKYKLLEARIKRAEGNIALIKRKTFTDKDQLKDKLGEFDKEINKGGGLLSKMNLINMIAGYAMDAVILVIASTGLAYAVEAKNRLDDHDKRFGKIYNFLTNDLYDRFQFIWDEFSHINEDATMVHLEVQRTDTKLKALTAKTDVDRAQLTAVRELADSHHRRLADIDENQEDLMVFRNRVEMLMVVVAQFFERNNISFTDMEGGLIDMTTIRAELEGAYNYLRELISSQAAEMKIANRLLVLRNDELARQLEEEQELREAEKRAFEQRLAEQDAQIKKLTARLESAEIAAGSIDLAPLLERLAAVEEKASRTAQAVAGIDSSIDYMRGIMGENRRRLTNLEDRMVATFQDHSQRISENQQWVEGLRRDVDELRDQQLNTNSLATRVNNAESAIRGLQADQVEMRGAVSALERTTSDLRVGQQAATSERSQLRSMAANQQSLINSLRGNMSDINSSISSANDLISRLRTACNAMKSQHILKSWVPSQTTDGNGFMRLSMSSFPSDIISYSNDYIVSIQPYDCRVSSYDRMFAAWADFQGDGQINVALRWAYDTYIGKVGGGNRIRVWYWAKNPAANNPV